MKLKMPWISEAKSEEREDTNFILVANPDDLRALFATSSREPAAFFIHDRSCPISNAAYREMSAIGGDVQLLLTGDGQHLSAEVERHTGVRHESPQVIILQQGKPRWSASHYRIRRKDVLGALASVASGSRE